MIIERISNKEILIDRLNILSSNNDSKPNNMLDNLLLLDNTDIVIENHGTFYTAKYNINISPINKGSFVAKIEFVEDCNQDYIYIGFKLRKASLFVFIVFVIMSLILLYNNLDSLLPILLILSIGITRLLIERKRFIKDIMNLIYNNPI